MDNIEKEKYVEILKQELIPALGCTEPIAVAYASAKARELLGCIPEKAIISCSGNIIKNVKGVIVPTTSDMKGISAAAAVGITGGDPSRKLEVLTTVTEETLAEAKELLEKNIFEERVLHSPAKLKIIIELFAKGHRVLVEIIHTHTGIVRIEKDDEILLDLPYTEEEKSTLDYGVLNLKDIYNFSQSVELEKVQPILERQVAYNIAIAQEGLKGEYGANIGRTLMEMFEECPIEIQAAAMAAAGSDARMSGCEMPVVINSGSGNQGITVSVPVYVYARKLEKSEEELYRALTFANLTAIYQKSMIGRLSAYCGAINAAVGAAAGVAFLMNMSRDRIDQVIINAIAGVSGVVCDGAKPSCAAKIAAGLQAALMSIRMVEKHRGFQAGEGLVKEGAEKTLDCIAKLARDGMEITDSVILDLMVSAIPA